MAEVRKIWNANANANNCIRLQWGLVVDGAPDLEAGQARVQAAVRVAVLDQVLDRVVALVALVVAQDLGVVVSVRSLIFSLKRVRQFFG